jgi:hypothetical protein
MTTTTAQIDVTKTTATAADSHRFETGFPTGVIVGQSFDDFARMCSAAAKVTTTRATMARFDADDRAAGLI